MRKRKYLILILNGRPVDLIIIKKIINHKKRKGLSLMYQDEGTYKEYDYKIINIEEKNKLKINVCNLNKSALDHMKISNSTDSEIKKLFKSRRIKVTRYKNDWDNNRLIKFNNINMNIRCL
jgi:hypothetical protein